MGWEWFVSAVLAVVRITVFGHLEEKTPLRSRLSKWAFYLWRDRGAVAKAGETLDVRLDLWPAQPGACVPPGVVQKARIDAFTAEPRDKDYELQRWGNP